MLQQGLAALGADARNVLQLAVRESLAAQGPVMGDGCAVGLVADALHELQLRRVVIQHDGLLAVGQPDFLQPLRQAEHRDVQPLGEHRLAGEAHLLRAAVDQDEVGQIGEFAADGGEPLRLALGLLLHAVGKAAGQHLIQRGEVVRALHGFDPELAVFLLRRFAVDEDDHRADALHALRVGDVVALDAAGEVLQPEDPAEARRRADRALLPHRGPGVALLEGVPRVLLREQHQVVLLAAPGHQQSDRRALLLTQPLLQLLLRALGEGLHEDVAGNQPALLVVLGEEFREHFAGILAALALQQEVVAAEHPPAAHIDDLHHGVQAVLAEGDDVLLAAVGADGDLPLHQPAHVPDLVAVGGGFLVLHALRGLLHAAGQLVNDRLVIAGEEGQHAVHHVPVLGLGALPRARREAFLDVVIDAGAHGPLQREGQLAGAQREHVAHRVDHLLHRRRADVGPKVPRAVLLHPPRERQPREGLMQVHAQIGIVLVVLEEDVVIGPVLLDEVALQAQRLQVAVT